MQKAIVIAGPTASGKTAISLSLAKKIGGEIVSADSRQVYRGLDIGSGKVTKKEMAGVPHYLLDVANPKKTYSAGEYVKDARAAIEQIAARGKVPIIVGGTGFYIDALIGLVELPEVERNLVLRKKLAAFSLEKLQKTLKKLDPERYQDIDVKNPVRLIRAIEITQALGKVPKKSAEPLYEVLYIGVMLPLEELKKKIHTRLIVRMKKGMLSEAKRLHAKGLSWKRMEELGLEYRYMARHLQGKISRQEMLRELESEINKYAKRQMTWFKKNKSIRWYLPKEKNAILKKTKNFLT